MTRDFGDETLHEGVDQDTAPANEGDTVMRLLQSKYDVKTRYGGGFVQAIDGVAGGQENGRRADWFYYVNGIEAPVGAAERRVSAGDHVWWDHHTWDAAQRVPAVVGSFPEPFLSGSEGKRFPVRLVCVGEETRSCDEVQTRLDRRGREGAVARGPGAVGRQGGAARHRRPLGRRPPRPGRAPARARPAGERRVRAADEHRRRDRPARRATASRCARCAPASGLVAATSVEAQAPTWVVSGTDDVGVAAAAAALTKDRLAQHFALAIDGGRDVPLPVSGAGTGP